MVDSENANSDSQKHLDDLNESRRGRVVNIGIFVGLILLAVFGIYIKLRGPSQEETQFAATETQVASLAIRPVKSPTTIATSIRNAIQATSTPIIIKDTTNKLPQENYSAQVSCEEISKVNLRKSPGYVSKNDSKDVIVEIPCGEPLNLQFETKFVDELTWWKVSWRSYEGWVSDHTGSGKSILIFTQPSSFAQSRPEEFLFWYFNAVWSGRNYEDLWANFLTPSFQNHSSNGNFNEYVKWWKTVNRIDINTIEIVQQKEFSAWARININLYLNDGRILKSRKYDYSLVFDAAKSVWMFDYP